MLIPKSLSEKIAHRKQRTHRIEELADGVFAIAMTLLVLDIRIPLEDMIKLGVRLYLELALPKFLTYILSFSIAGLLWSAFVNQFNYIHASDRNENIIGIFFLMFISLLPFTSSFLSSHLESKVAVGLYVFNIILIVLLLLTFQKFTGILGWKLNIGD